MFGMTYAKPWFAIFGTDPSLFVTQLPSRLLLKAFVTRVRIVPGGPILQCGGSSKPTQPLNREVTIQMLIQMPEDARGRGWQWILGKRPQSPEGPWAIAL